MAYPGPRRPINNRPQIDNLPHKVTSVDKIREIRFIGTIYYLVTELINMAAPGFQVWNAVWSRYEVERKGATFILKLSYLPIRPYQSVGTVRRGICCLPLFRLASFRISFGSDVAGFSRRMDEAG